MKSLLFQIQKKVPGGIADNVFHRGDFNDILLKKNSVIEK